MSQEICKIHEEITFRLSAYYRVANCKFRHYCHITVQREDRSKSFRFNCAYFFYKHRKVFSCVFLRVQNDIT